VIPALLIALGLVALEAVLPSAAHGWPGLFTGVGLVGGLAIGLGAKALGVLGLQRPEPHDE
jgi:hypothetical protein